MTTVYCEGWWEQGGLGRQAMGNLQLSFAGVTVTGSGFDIVGEFTLRGEMVDGRVALVKQYIGRHFVEYLGTYDGEGLMAGDWRIGGFRGNWLIRIRAVTPSADEQSIIDII